jgi:hypothetical protein
MADHRARVAEAEAFGVDGGVEVAQAFEGGRVRYVGARRAGGTGGGGDEQAVERVAREEAGEGGASGASADNEVGG